MTQVQDRPATTPAGAAEQPRLPQSTALVMGSTIEAVLVAALGGPS
jgi:hypothetical protein